MGSKYKTLTKACPSGAMTESTNYDTSGCTAAPSPAGTVNILSRCALTPDACASPPAPASCPSGTHWTLMGSNTAHCVQDDMACPWSYSLKHDFLGNPTCNQNTCPATQSLQGDGVSCGCSAGSMWNGSSCVASAPTCIEQEVEVARSCSVGYTGIRWRTVYYTCLAGPYGAQTITNGAWDTYDCEPIGTTPAPTPTCTVSTYTDTALCSTEGWQTRQVVTSCPSGSTGAPYTSYSSWDTSGCLDSQSPPAPTPTPTPLPAEGGGSSPSCSQTSSTSASSCGSGYSGTQTITTTYLCPSGTSTSVDTSGCGCANGANDYPLCTPPPPPPAPKPVTCSVWREVSPPGSCIYPESDFPHTYSRTCSDGTTETEILYTNVGPCAGSGKP